jgi:hypothetical protein
MNLRQLRRSCQAKVEALELPSPFDVQAFCAVLERTRGRPIHLVPITLSAGGPSGICVSTRTDHYVFYESHTSPLHQEHIILHEVAHLLCEHQAVVSNHELRQLLFPDLAPHTIERVLGRTCYATWAEQEAELIASLILAKAERHPPETPWAVGSDVAPVLARVARSLGTGRDQP